MAAKTFSLTDNGAATGQALSAKSTCALIQGTATGGTLHIEASHNNTVWAPIPDTNSNVIGANAFAKIIRCEIPNGWYVRPVLLNATGTIAITVAIE
jgi:hypothetical protein